MKNKHPWIGTAALVAYSGFIFYLSSLPASQVPKFPLPDELLHFIIYFGLGVVFSFFLKNLRMELKQIITLIAVILFLGLFGFGDEFHQTYVAGRTFDMLDLIMDIIGGVSGHLLFRSTNIL